MEIFAQETAGPTESLQRAVGGGGRVGNLLRPRNWSGSDIGGRIPQCCDQSTQKSTVHAPAHQPYTIRDDGISNPTVSEFRGIWLFARPKAPSVVPVERGCRKGICRAAVTLDHVRGSVGP